VKVALENLTSYDGRRIRGIVGWVFRELDCHELRCTVRIKQTAQTRYSYKGRYYSGSGIIICTLGNAPFPHVHDRSLRGGPPPIVVESWEEALIAITAHEVMHLRQHRIGSMRNVRFSEVEAEWAEFRLLNRWRGKRSIGKRQISNDSQGGDYEQ